MDEFCGSPFWDSQLTWNTSNPYLTPCFENAILSIVPFLFLLAFGWTDFLNYYRSKERQPIHYSWIFIGKCITNIGVIVVVIQQFIRLNLTDLRGIGQELRDADMILPMLQVFGYVGILFLSLLTRSRLISSSGTQFFFWLLTLVVQIVLFRTAIDKYENEQTKESIILLSRIISFPMICIRFLLEFFADDAKDSSSNIKIGNPSPDKTSTFISKLLFLWYDRLAWEGYRGRLTKDNLWDLNPDDTSESQTQRFSQLWKEEEEKALKSGKEASILGPLVRCYGLTYAYGLFLKLCGDLIVFIQPELIRLLVAYITTSNEEEWKGYLYTSALFIGVLIQSVLNSASMKKTVLVAMRIRTALSNAVYRKSLFISNSSKMETTVGETQNLMSVDAQKFVELLPFITTASTSPVQIGVSIYLLYNTLGPSVFAGLGVLLLLIPINGVIAGISRKFQMEQMKLKDERIKLSSEVLSGIKVLKLYAWETSYQKQIEEIRAKELISLRKAAFLNTSTVFIFLCAPVLVAVATFATYVLSDSSHILNAEKTYVSMSLFNIIRLPMVTLPMALAISIQAMVSVKRLNSYLNKPELDQSAVTHDESYEDPITIQNGSFSWTQDSTTLTNINLSVKKGELLAVVGTIGSGKSSLLCSLLGDLTKTSGFVNTKGSLAYVSQGAWIQNATLRDNVLFGDHYNVSKYNRVLEACALKTDLSILANGDQTEIGEKGINLSGGQKQRVSLARAAYKNSSIYLLDDPLSAVDSHVGKHIFENVIGSEGILSKSTRVLVTHGVQYLPFVDRIVVMKDGKINEIGTYKELLQKRGEFAEFLLQHIGEDEDMLLEDDENLDPDKRSILHDLESIIGAEEVKRRRSSISSSTRQINDPAAKLIKRLYSKQESVISNRKVSVSTPRVSESLAELPLTQPKLIEEEAIALGNTKLRVFWDYFKSAGIPISIIALMFNAIGNGLMGYSNIWLAEWSTQSTFEEITNTTSSDTTSKYLTGYGLIGGAQAIATLIGSGALAILSLEATRTLHNNGLSRLLRAPMSYFDTTLLGRLINQLSREVDIMDNIIPLTLRAFINMLFSVLATFVVISIKLPIFIAFIIPMGVVYFFLQRFYVATSRQLKRWESVTRSPIYSHFGYAFLAKSGNMHFSTVFSPFHGQRETISGSTTIRAFQLENDFITESERRIDTNSRSFFPFMMSSMWISIRLEFLGGLIIFFTCLLTILTRDSMEPGSAGLAISYALSVTSVLNFLARQTTDLETNIVSVERLTELTQVPQEAPSKNPSTQPPADWPAKGEVKFSNYSTRYREGLDLVIKGINCTIRPGEKIGVVGRTGAGKSSLTLALFRLIEPVEGKIWIDGLDISKLGLHDLRSKITIIPQDPVLFSGSLRLNLDPFNQYSDEQVWRCLELAHLKPYISTLAEGLQYKVEEEGKNFSVGQRQLICLARALLRSTQILVLDEATAAVDLETDDLIQATIRKEFISASVITIAHRLNTIMDSTRVMVLDKGEIKEFDSPASLLEDSSSIFWGMAKDAKII